MNKNENKKGMGSTVVKKSLDKREEENNKTSQVDEKNDILVDPLETDNRMEKGTTKRLEETQKRKKMKGRSIHDISRQEMAEMRVCYFSFFQPFLSIYNFFFILL